MPFRTARFTRTEQHAKDRAFKIRRPLLRAMMWREHRYERLRDHRRQSLDKARAEAEQKLGMLRRLHRMRLLA